MGRAFPAWMLAGTILASPAWAGTIEVRNGQSIQEAINRASAGDTVLVQPGTYSAFEVTKNNITVKSAQQGGAHVIARGDNQPAIGSYGQSGVSILGFRLTSERGDGMKIGGSPGNMASNLRVEGNIVESARLDGLKAFQARGMSMNNNTVKLAGSGGPAGSSGNPNGDGGLDWVQIENSEMVGNSVSTNGWACAMIKNGSNGNRIANNRFQRCEVNGLDMAAGSSGRAKAANTSGKVAFNNVIEGNTIDGGKGCAAKFDETSTNNKLAGSNQIGGRVCDQNGSNNANANPNIAGVGSSSSGGQYAVGQPVAWGQAPLDAEKITNDISVMRANGLNDSAIKYVFQLDGIEMPDSVLAGEKSVKQAIDDGTMKQGSAPATWSPPKMPVSPKPDLTPRGSSASDWAPSFDAPTIQQMRQSITSRPRPPGC